MGFIKPWVREPVISLKTDKQGQLISAAIVHSSGDSKLDADSVEKIKQTLPLPPIPKDLGEETLEFLLSPNRSKLLTNPLLSTEYAQEEKKNAYDNQQWVASIIKPVIKKRHTFTGFSKDLRVTIILIVYEETGEILFKKVYTSSCVQAYDRLMLSLIQSPFPPVPVVSKKRMKTILVEI